VAGDKVLLIQMKGVAINHEDDPNFGQVLGYGSAGFHEILEVLSVNAGAKTIQFTNTIKASYNANDDVQIVKIAKYTNYTVPSGGLTCDPWDGKKGGVLFIEVPGTLTLNGDINTSGKGFRGGDLLNESIGNAVLFGTSPEETFSNGRWVIENKQIPYTDYSGTDQYFYYTWYYSGQKGEGVANYNWPQEELGRGPLGSGGGAGIKHNTGGHGGFKYGYNAGGGCRTDKGYGLGGYALGRMGGLRLYLGGCAGSGHENNNCSCYLNPRNDISKILI